MVVCRAFSITTHNSSSLAMAAEKKLFLPSSRPVLSIAKSCDMVASESEVKKYQSLSRYQLGNKFMFFFLLCTRNSNLHKFHVFCFDACFLFHFGTHIYVQWHLIYFFFPIIRSLLHIFCAHLLLLPFLKISFH
jgi:hypothetical protein